MRLVHLSDLHLGYRQYQRLTPTGINQREADVAAAFGAAIGRTIALRPDAVVVAGDIFHTVRPTNQAILFAFLQFSRLRRELPDAAIVLVAGNHDTPRLAETGGILQLFAQLGLEVVDREPRQIRFPHLDLSVLAIPGGPGIVKPSLSCDPEARFNVLVVHGRVPGAIPELPGYEVASVEYTRAELSSAPWDYVALGDYHVHHPVGKNAWYSGSLEYTSLNPWRDIDEQRDGGVKGKGFAEHDLASGEHTFHHVEGARQLIDLAPVQARGLTPADIDARIRTTVDGVKGGIDDKVVRLIVRDVSRQVARELDHKAIRDYKRRALNFHLDLRRPELFKRESVAGSPGRRVELREIVAEKIRARPIDADVDREALVSRAVAYVDEAQTAAVAAPSLVAEV